MNVIDRFRGCLLGVALGDAWGGLFEAQSREALAARFSSVTALAAYAQRELWYTDDTQMTIGVAQTLVEHGEILERTLCRVFVANYVPSRGYGRGARAVIEAMEDGRDHQQVAERYFPGGSYGNGAAMRVAPVGLLFHDDPPRLREQAVRSALPTHRHPLGIEGARLLATGVGFAVRSFRFDRQAYFDELEAACESDDFRRKIAAAARAESWHEIASLGNGIEALQSVPTALAAFALSPDSYEQAIGGVVLLGGDTDTLAAMTGALSGAYVGADRLPKRLVDLLENGPQGRDFLALLAGRLHDIHVARRSIDAVNPAIADDLGR